MKHTTAHHIVSHTTFHLPPATCRLPPNCFSCCSMNMLNCLLQFWRGLALQMFINANWPKSAAQQRQQQEEYTRTLDRG